MRLIKNNYIICMVISLSILFTATGYCQETSLVDFLPKHSPQDQIVNHFSYTLKYNEQYEQAEWVCYFLSKDKTSGSIDRTDNFRQDSLVKTLSASLSDYKGSGFDRGHLAPAGDMKWSEKAMSESFFMSNMSPQRPGFNRGIWRSLESLVRNWAVENEEIYIVTGGVLKGNLSTIGLNEVGVPEYYYKVILDNKEPELKGIGFILRNESFKTPLQTFAVSIDSVESVTGIDFFPVLPDDIESEIESSVELDKWTFKASRIITSSKSSSFQSVQCKGITKKGARCKRLTKNENGFCWQHQSQVESVESDKTIEPEPTISNTVYVTKSGKKYHKGSCSLTLPPKVDPDVMLVSGGKKQLKEVRQWLVRITVRNRSSAFNGAPGAWLIK